MSKYRDPLSDAFDIEDDSFVDEQNYVEIEIPEIKDLEFTIQRALADYKEVKEVIQLVEPKNRLKYFEMARDFLDLAKDAMFKRDTLILKREELAKRQTKQTPTHHSTSDTNSLTEGESSDKVYTREELEAQRKLRLVGNTQ